MTSGQDRTEARKRSHAAYRARNREKLNAKAREWAAQHRDEAREKDRARRAADPEIMNERTRKWRAVNRSKAREASRAWKEKHPDRTKELSRQSAKNWKAANPAKAIAAEAAREAAKINATPRWASLEEIEQFYIEARRLSIETGVPHQVDHIVPLVHKIVCGLHISGNLQILTASENASKGNRWFPGMDK